MIQVTYDPFNGASLPDALVADYIETAIKTHANLKEKLEKPVHRIDTGSEFFLKAFRVAVKNGLLPHDELVFVYEGKEYSVDENIKIVNRPDGLDDRFMSMSAILAKRDV